MTTASVSVFENLVYRKIKKCVSDKFSDILTEVVDVDGASEGEKHEAEEKGLEMIWMATEEFIASKRR